MKQHHPHEAAPVFGLRCFCMQTTCRYIFCVDPSQHLKRAALLLLKDVFFAVVSARTTTAMRDSFPSERTLGQSDPRLSGQHPLSKREGWEGRRGLSPSAEEDYVGGEPSRGGQRFEGSFIRDDEAKLDKEALQSGKAGQMSQWERSVDAHPGKRIIQALEDLVDLKALLKRVSGDLVERRNLLGSSVKAAALLLLGKWRTVEDECRVRVSR